MSISYVGTSYTAGVTATKPITVNFSGGNWSGGSVQAGDIVLVCASIRAYGQEAYTVDTTGYTIITPNPVYADDIFDTAFFVAYKVMGSTPDTSVSVRNVSDNTTIPMVVMVYVLRGVDTTTPIDVTTTTTSGIDSSEIDCPSITPTTSGALVVAMGSTSSYNIITFTEPSGYSNKAQGGSDPKYATSIVASMKLWSGSGAENPGAYTPGSTDAYNSWCAATVALRPLTIVGPTNLKSYNTNLKANIKTINTNTIANVKSLNTNM